MFHVHRLSQGQIPSSLLTSFPFEFPCALAEIWFFVDFCYLTVTFCPLQTKPHSESKTKFFLYNASPTCHEISASKDMQALLSCKHYWSLTQEEISLKLTLNGKEGDTQKHLLTISVFTDWPIN